jgi:anaerobic ribonucleoside-triphosphate reductase activating protein
VRWSRFLAATAAEGPGIRAAVWLQGCSVQCPGCFNPQLWADRGASVDETEALAHDWARQAVASGSEGVTLLGGEPFDQAEASAIIAEAFRAAGLTVMTFSGYPRELLDQWSADRPDIARLMAATDLLADGPYLRDHPDTRRPWIGSVNQGLTALTPVYAEQIAAIEREGGLDRVEIRILASGEVEVNGWADTEALELLLDDLGTRTDSPNYSSRRTQPRRVS